jgi:hypothetical protein
MAGDALTEFVLSFCKLQQRWRKSLKGKLILSLKKDDISEVELY